MFLFHNQFNGTEWPIMRWCAVKKLLTHSLTLARLVFSSIRTAHGALVDIILLITAHLISLEIWLMMSVQITLLCKTRPKSTPFSSCNYQIGVVSVRSITQSTVICCTKYSARFILLVLHLLFNSSLKLLFISGLHNIHCSLMGHWYTMIMLFFLGKFAVLHVMAHKAQFHSVTTFVRH